MVTSAKLELATLPAASSTSAERSPPAEVTEALADIAVADTPTSQPRPAKKRLSFFAARDIVEELMRMLGDSTARNTESWWHYIGVLNELGADALREFAHQALRIESEGGMLTKDGSRRRTPGGVFFVLVRSHLGTKRDRNITAGAARAFDRDMVRRFSNFLALVVPAPVIVAPSLPEVEAVPASAAAPSPVPPPVERPAPVATSKAAAVTAPVPAPVSRPVPPPMRRPQAVPACEAAAVPSPRAVPPPVRRPQAVPAREAAAVPSPRAVPPSSRRVRLQPEFPEVVVMRRRVAPPEPSPATAMPLASERPARKARG